MLVPSEAKPQEQTFLSPLVQPTSRAPAPAGVSYEAIESTGTNDPPDPSIAIGPNDLVVVTNNVIRFYNKANPGNILHEDTLDNWYTGTVPIGVSFFDPKVIYDQFNGHYIILAMGKKQATNQSWWLVSASPGPSTAGIWHFYALDATLNNTTPTANWADHPGIGIDGVALYLTANMFTFAQGGGFQYAKIRIVNLANIYAGGSLPPWVDLWGLQNTSGTMASFIEPASRYELIGPPMFLVNASTSGNSLTFWRIDNPLSPTPTLTKWNVAVDPSSAPPDAEQPNTATRISTGASTRLFQAQYRFGGIWTANVVSYNTVDGPHAAIRLYEIKSGGSGLWNQMVLWNPDFYMFNPSFATDTDDNFVVSFSLSGRTDFPSIWYTGRLASDPSNTIYTVITLLKASTVSYQNGGNPTRWGDYSGTALDPATGCTVWMYNEFAKTGTLWSTWIGNAAYKFRVFLPVILNNS